MIIVTANTRRSYNVILMLGQRLRRWANIKTTLGQRLVFAPMILDITKNTYSLAYSYTDRVIQQVCLKGKALYFFLWKIWYDI